jgi:hypothetical protein
MKSAAATAQVVVLHPEPQSKEQVRPARLTYRPAPAHKAAARMVLDTLHLASQDGLQPFWGLAVVLRGKLTASERQSLAWAALMACDDDEAAGIAEAVLEPSPGAGWPLPPLFDAVDEAAFWAGHASGEDLRAYLLTCFRALSARDRAEFLSFAQGRAAA